SFASDSIFEQTFSGVGPQPQARQAMNESANSFENFVIGISTVCSGPASRSLRTFGSRRDPFSWISGAEALTAREHMRTPAVADRRAKGLVFGLLSHESVPTVIW